MKTLTILLLVTSAVLKNGNAEPVQPTQVPFVITCLETPSNTAEITITKKHQLGEIGPCKPTLKAGTSPGISDLHTYTLSADCLTNNGQFLVYQVDPNNADVIGDGKKYHVICDKNKERVVSLSVNSGIRIDLPNGNPEIKKVTDEPYSDKASLKLGLLKSPPSLTGVIKTDFPDTPSATLGETLYLVLARDSLTPITGTLDLIPLDCTATAGSKKAPFWNLNDQTSKTCTYDGSIVTTVFTEDTSFGSTYKLYTATIQAFQFIDQQSSTITISCNVRVCTTAKSQCKEDKKALPTCAAKTPSTRRRRRREVEDGSGSHGRVHQVSATFRVVEDVMAQGTDGSSTTTYTLPCLLMSLLAKVIF